jgi:NitT/TauT family transport system ATP-binding protein
VTSSGSVVIRLNRIGLQYRPDSPEIMRDVGLAIHQNEFVSIVGPSGCGKSSLLRMFAGLLDPTNGTVERAADTDTAAGVSRIGFVFQQPTLLPWRTAAENLTLPLELGRRSDGAVSRERISELLTLVGLSDSDAEKRPAELSGGMQMRLSLARALIVRPRLLLLDEPLAAVDDLLRTRLQEDVSRIHCEQKLTTILVTHNLHEAVFLSDRVIILNGTPARVTQDLQIPFPQPRTAAFRESRECFDIVNRLTRDLFATAASRSDDVPGS